MIKDVRCPRGSKVQPAQPIAEQYRFPAVERTGGFEAQFPLLESRQQAILGLVGPLAFVSEPAGVEKTDRVVQGAELRT